MASKPIDPRPVALPNLSQLPDPTKDLFGSMTSPTALMSMSEKEVNDLFSVKPLTDMHIKPSAEAAKALQVAQQTQEAINRQAQQAQEELARQEREIAEQRQRSIDEQIKLIRKDAEERAKALKEKAEKQGGKVGAAPDGSFVLTTDINKTLSSSEWNSVVSDKQRADKAEQHLADYERQLREMGATDEQIAAEIENGRGIFKAHTDAYTKSMRSDGQGLFDLTVAPAAKTGAFIFNTVGVMSKLVSADTVGDFLLERGKAATDAAHDFESASIKLDRANSAYDELKFNEANPNANLRDGGIIGAAHGMSAAVKRAWNNGTLDNFVAEQVPQLIMTLGAGKAGATGVSAAGRAMGYTNLAANNVPTALRVLGGTYKTKSGVTQLGVNLLSGSSLGMGAYGIAAGVGDAGAGAWEQVKSTSFDDIKKTYGEKKWAEAVALHGGEEQARDALAGEALERAASKVAPIAAVTSFLGVESTFAALLTRQAIKEEAKKLTVKGFVKGVGNAALSATEEGVEEGYTQYASNIGATEFTGVDLMEGVSSAAGLGAFMGGATTAVTNIMSAAKKENDTLPNDFAKAFVEQGNFDDKAFRQNFERKMDWLSRGHKEGKVSTNDTQHFQQTYFNDYIDTAYTVTREDGSTDTKSIWDLMTPEQVQDFKDYVRLNYGINTNDYSRHQDTVEYDAIKNNNMEVLSRPENTDLLNVWRILNNTDTDQVPADKRDYYTAIAEVTNYLRPTETTHNTHEREQLFSEFWNTQLDNRGFDAIQRAGITEFVRTILGANSRRFTDEEQQAWNELQQEQSNGTNEQAQTNNSQSGGQGPIDENAEPVAEESTGTDTAEATTLQQAAEELANAFSRGPTGSDAQSTGDGNPRQGADTSNPTNAPTADGAGANQPNAGSEQAQTTSDTVNSPATEIHSGTPTQSGNIGQANQGGQPTRPTVANPTQTTTSGGSVGTPQTKRNTNGGGKQTPTQTANSLAETGADIPIEFVQQFINNNKPKKLTLAKVKGYVADKLGVPVTKTSPTQAQVLQYLAKIPNAQFIADLSAVFTSKGGKIVKDSQNTINDLHSTRHELYKAWAKSQPKTNPEQATTDTNADNGSQDVNDTNVADTIIEGNNNAEPNSTTANDTSQAEADSNDTGDANPKKRPRAKAASTKNKTEATPTQDTAGASGLADDTQTSASQAEPVKPKRGGRSKKKTTTQLDLSEQEQTNADKQAEGISQERHTGLSNEYRQPTETPTTPLDIEQESQAYKNELKADFLHRVQNGEILAIQRHIDEFTKQLIAKKDDDIRATNTAKKRAKDFGEVTTPVSVIDDMLETLRSGGSNFNIDLNAKILDPATGDGRYLLRALVRRSPRIFMESDLVAGNILRALASLTGVELQTENAQRARNNLYSVGLEYFKLANIDPTPYINALQQITTNAIIEGDTLNPNSDMLVHTYTVIDDIGVQHYVAPYTDVVQGKNNLTQQDTIIFDSITQQEQTNAKENNLGQSVQPTQERTQDDNQTDIVGVDNTPNERQREVLGQSGQPISEQSQGSGIETTQDTEQLGVGTPKPKKKRARKKDNAVAKEINEAVEKDRLQKEFDLINDYHNSLPLSKQEDTVEDFIAKVGYALALEQSTTWQQAEADAQAKLKAEREARWAKLREQEAQGIYEDDFDISENPSAVPSDIDTFTSERGVRRGNMGSQTGAVELDFLLALPTAVYRAAKAIWDAIKKNVAAVSMALAITTGTTLAIPTEANAATPTETAVVQNIVEQNDNQGKQFIVADKQAGTLTMYTASGQQITSTPALFGKTEGDSVSSKNTPSGRFETKQANVRTEGYGGSAQVLTQNGQNLQLGGSPYAIHRVYTKYASENRQGRLDTPTATDNRISHGCINVPVNFYDTYLNSDQDTVVYVMPETDAGRTGVFNVVPTATQTATDTKEQVEPAYDNANAQSVEVTPEQLTNATPHDQVKVAPKLVPTPLIVKGTEQSTQVAYTTPTVLGGANGTAPITADRIVTPKIDGKVVHTPAEQRADTSFDTEPVKDKTDDGVSLAEVAVGLAAAFAGGMYVNRRRERAKAKKLESKKRTPVADNPPPTDSTPTPDPTPNMPQDPPTTEQVQGTVNAEHNEQVNKSANNAKTIPTDIKTPPQPTATALAVNREMWIKYLVETNQLGYTGSQEMADMLFNTLRGFEYSNLAIMTDLSYQQANDGTFDRHRWWGDGEVNTDRTGVFNKFISIAAGATPVFDNLMGKLGIARGGHEADSSLASIALAQVKSKSQGAYAQIHKFFVGPMVARTKLLAQELRRGDEEVELATGRVATAKHVLNEAADAMWKGFEAELAHLQDSLAKVNADLAATPSNKDYPLRTMNTAKKLEDEIRQVSDLYTRTRNMYEGKAAWDGETKLPGGMTKARAEQDIAEVKAEYGADYAKIEENAKELAKSIRGIRQFATAAGVFTNEDLEVFNELGFDEYVPLYAEERDPTDMNEEDNYTHSSIMDRLMQGIPLTQARSMGLTKDLSRYRRKGAKSPAADGFTNMKKFATNMAGRIGQQNWVEITQQLYEGTVGKPYSAANITDPNELADLNASYDSGKVPGLIRVRPGTKDFLPADVKTKIDKVRPIIGKGRNANGDTVVFEYYWTEPAIQAEIYANTDLSDTLTKDRLRNIGTATRAAARLVTVGKPVWNIYNFVRDSFERVSVMLMRPVKDQSGKLVPKWKLAMEFFRALPTIALHAKDIYRYLVLGEVKTPLQIVLNEAVGEGAINLMTTQTEKHSVIGDLKKSQLEKAGNKISKWLGDTANKTGAGGVRNAMVKGFDFYIVAMTEIPQVSTALASYMAYQNAGVNKKETANRVRDAYDPNRTNNEIIHNIGQFHPFVRSTFSGHYNLARSLTQYWKPGEWQFTLGYVLGGTLGVIGLLSMLAGAFDDDDDGRSALARLPLSTLTGGIPVPWGENGVWALPVGFGMNKLIWGVGANFYRYLNGYQNAGETTMGLIGLLVDNTSPVQAASGTNLAENPTAAAVLTAMPMLVKPVVEMGFNAKSYGGGKVWSKDTPRDQLDSQQDNFNTPETYKKWAMWLNENGFGDYRPETIQHLFESYGNLAGPLSAIPQSVIADQSEKTLGNKERKGEVFGATLTALGAGMSIQPNALDIASLTYEMDARRYELHRKYGVGESHTEEIYEQYAQRGKRGAVLKDAKYVTEVRLREKGVPEDHIKYIINGMEYQDKRKKLDKEFKDLALEYNRLVASGKDDPQMRQSVQNAWDALEKLTTDYVKENNNVFFTLRK